MTRFLATLLAVVALAAAALAAEKHSGYDDAGPQVRAMQDDDSQNPAFLWVKQGEALWSERVGTAQKSCADCHGEAAKSMRGVAARYPKWSPRDEVAITLERQINRCRDKRQGAEELSQDSDQLIGLTAYVGLQSRGMTVAVEMPPGEAESHFKEGETIFHTRMGQLNLSCANCHDDLAGQKLAGAPIPQGHPNGYPLYRLEWQGMGTLYRRIRNCMTGVRAEPFNVTDTELAALELYHAVRSNGLTVETPAVRP